MDCHRGPQSRSERLHNNEGIKGTATAVRSPVVKDCIIMRTVTDCHRGPQSHSERLSWLTAILEATVAISHTKSDELKKSAGYAKNHKCFHKWGCVGGGTAVINRNKLEHE